MSSPPEGRPSGGSKRLALCAGVLALAAGGVVLLRARAPASARTHAPVFEPGVVDLEPFVLNIPDPAGDRFLRLAVRLVLDQRAVAERAAAPHAQVKLRDLILALLQDERASVVATPEGREALRAELAAETERLLAEAPFVEAKSGAAPARVTDVLFTEFLLQ